MKRIVSLLLAAVLAPLILCQSAAAEGVSSSAPPQQNSGSIQKAVVFTLDASNSMNGNDRNRLAIDSIAQLIYSLPSNYVVGVVAYNTDIVAAQGMADSGSRDSIMKAADSVRYTGYTNAGTGLTKALELLDTVEASEKTVVMLSDGEIVMQDDAATAVSSGQFENAVTEAKNSGVVIHVIGLGADMENKANTIFSASAETGGANYHAPRAEDIQQAVDSILLEQLNIKKTTAAVVDADGGTEELDITIPTANATNARLLFISDSPIRNLNADFSAGGGLLKLRPVPGVAHHVPQVVFDRVPDRLHNKLLHIVCVGGQGQARIKGALLHGSGVPGSAIWFGVNAADVFLDTPGRIIHNPKAVLDLCAGCPRQGGQLACNALLYAGAGSGDRHSDQKCKDDGQDGPDDDRQLRSQFQFPKQHRFPHSVSLQNAALWA